MATLATEEQRTVLMALARSWDRGEADRARAVLLTLSGWTSPRIAEAFGVREDTVRLWRSDFMRDGVAALESDGGARPGACEERGGVARGHAVAGGAGRRSAELDHPRLRAEIEAQAGVRISRSQLSKALRKKSSAGGGGGTR